MKTAAGIYNCGYHFLCTEIMKILKVDIDIFLESHLLERGKIKLRHSIREHDHVHFSKRKDNNHAKIRTELEKRKKDFIKNMDYGSQIVFKESAGKPDEKKEGGEKKKRGRRMRKNGTNIEIIVVK